MPSKVVHMYPWDGGTESDSDAPDTVYCWTKGNFDDSQVTNAWRWVTCKRCLKIHEKELENFA